MLKTDLIKKEYEFEFTDKNFNDLRDIITRETGIELPDNKKTLMYSRLARRIRELHLKDFSDYVGFIQTEIQNKQDHEMLVMINTMTTNVTEFFREMHHFEYLYKHMEELYDQFGKLRIWCAAASTGQEPWTLAMLSNSFIEKKSKRDVKIYASDIDKDVLFTASHGVYNLPPHNVMSNPFMKKYLQELPDDDQRQIKPLLNTKQYRVKDNIRHLVTYKNLNLVKEWNLPEKEYHVVFCRNVIIYFSKETQRAIFAKMAEKMPSGALLFIGHSESLHGVSSEFEPCGKTTYRKK